MEEFSNRQKCNQVKPKRVFVAIDIPTDLRDRVGSYIAHLRTNTHGVRIGWERAEKLHITLKFLGSIDDAELQALTVGLSRLATRYSPFTADLAGTGVFPNVERPRVLWIGVKNDGGAMTRLANEVEFVSRDCGFEADNRAFSPHLTIGRIRENGKSREIAALHSEIGFDPHSFSVSKLVVYESLLDAKGSCYTALSRHELSGASAI